MMRDFSHWFVLHSSVLFRCIFAFALSLLATIVLVWPRTNFRPRGQYNFSTFKQRADSGPLIGSTVDFQGARDQAGRSLSQYLQSSPLSMIVVIDPHCGACNAAQDEMLAIEEGIQDINYYVLMLCESANAEQYFHYMNSLRLPSKSFVWRTDIIQPPETLRRMVVPSHLLVNRLSVVIDKWPGTDPDREVGQRMASQIILETFGHSTH